jgi:thioredoxin 1
MAGQNTLTFTDHSFDRDVLELEVPGLVDFWGEGCPPCRKMSPTIDTIAEEYAGRVHTRDSDAANYSRAAASLRRRSAPLAMRGLA